MVRWDPPGFCRPLSAKSLRTDQCFPRFALLISWMNRDRRAFCPCAAKYYVNSAPDVNMRFTSCSCSPICKKSCWNWWFLRFFTNLCWCVANSSYKQGKSPQELTKYSLKSVFFLLFPLISLWNQRRCGDHKSFVCRIQSFVICCVCVRFFYRHWKNGVVFRECSENLW